MCPFNVDLEFNDTHCIDVADNIMGFDSEDELVAYYNSINDTMQDAAGVVFENLPPTGIPDHLTYKIRLSRIYVQTARLIPEFIGSGPGHSGNFIIHFFKKIFYIIITILYLPSVVLQPRRAKTD